MANINNIINSILPFNIYTMDALMASVDKAIDGSFKHIYDKACKHEINLIVDNYGNLIGGEYVSGLTGSADAAAQTKFMQVYSMVTLMEWVPLALKLAMRTDIADIEETETTITVVTKDGKREVVYEDDCDCDYDDDDCDYDYDDEDELPEELELTVAELRGMDVKSWLRATYGYYLAKGNELEIERDDEAGRVVVKNIKWGRKI